jgi:hypothetical protein
VIFGLATEHARSLDADCWDSDGEVCSVGGGVFGEQPCHSARKDVWCFAAEEEDQALSGGDHFGGH